MVNAYTHSRTEQEFATPEYADSDMRSYAVPTALSDSAPYIKEFGWAPSLRLSPESIPDATRLGTEPRREVVPDNGENPEQFWRPIDADKARRHSVEYQDADGWEEEKEYPGYPSAAAGANRWGRNPRETPPPEPRPTSRMAPRTYLFTRPFGTNTPKVGRRDLDGIHFSMADHRRTYDVLGMAPVRSWRNTYRLDPEPWDTAVTDMPPSNAPTIQDMQEVPVTVEVGYQSRNWRLG